MNSIQLGEDILESLYGTDDAIAHDGVLGMEWYKHKFGEYQEQAKYATKQTISTIQPVEKDAKSTGKSTVSVKVAKGATPNLETLSSISSNGSSKSSGSQTTTIRQVMRKPREQIYKETYDKVYAQLTGKLPNVESAVKAKNTSKSDGVEDFGADHAAAKQRMQEINETGGYYYNQLGYTDKKQHNTVKVIDKSTAEKLLRPSEFQRQSEAIKEAQKKASKAKSLKGSHTNAEIAKTLGVSESAVSYYLSHSDDMDSIGHDGKAGMHWYKHVFGKYQKQAQYAKGKSEDGDESADKPAIVERYITGKNPDGTISKEAYMAPSGKNVKVSPSGVSEDYGSDHAAAKQRIQELNETGTYCRLSIDKRKTEYGSNTQETHYVVEPVSKESTKTWTGPYYKQQKYKVEKAEKRASMAKSLQGSHTIAEIAKTLGVSESAVSYYLSHSDDMDSIAHDGRTGMHWYKHAFGKWQNHAQYANGKSDPNENSKDAPAIGKEYVTRKNPDGTTTKDEYMAPTGVYKGGSVKTNPTIYKLPGGNIVENYGNDFESTLGRLKELNQTGSYCGVWQGYKDDPKKLSFYVYPLGGDKEFAKTTLSESGIATQSAVVEQATQRASKAKSLQGSHTVEEIAELLGVSQSAVSYYLSK